MYFIKNKEYFTRMKICQSQVYGYLYPVKILNHPVKISCISAYYHWHYKNYFAINSIMIIVATL